MSATRNRLPDTRSIGMTTPSSGTDTSGARQWIRIRMRSADARHLAPIAIQRWEAEGGALDAVSHT
jgi:hypothetical protein